MDPRTYRDLWAISGLNLEQENHWEGGAGASMRIAMRKRR